MNVIDVFLLAVILLAGYSGFRKGFLHGTIDLLSLGISLVFAFRAFRYVAALFEKYIINRRVDTTAVVFNILHYCTFSAFCFGRNTDPENA